MMKLSALYPAFAASVALFALSCSKNPPTIDKETPDSGPVVLNLCDNAIPGQVLFKLSDEGASKLSMKSDMDGSADLGAAIEQIESVFEESQTVRFERLFKADPRFEERTKAEGLDRWFIAEYDGSIAFSSIVESLKGCTDLSVIEFCLETSADEAGKEAYAPSPAASEGSGRTAKSPFNEPYEYQMRQWDFNNTGTVGTTNCTPGADCNVYRAWELCTGNPDVVVAVLDQGVKLNHEDIADNIWVNPGEIPANGVDDDGNGYIDDVNGWNFVSNSPVITCSSKESHGTHVAGTIAAVNNNGRGVCGIAGGSGRKDGVKIMSLQILGASEDGASGAGIGGDVRAMKYAADNGAVVSQNSWGYGSGKITLEKWKFGVYSALSDAIRYFVKYAGTDEQGMQNGPMKGGIVVCSAGNDAKADLLHYPSSDPSVISVAATGMMGSPASYTNYATWVTLSAPGGNAADGSSYGQIYSLDIAEDEGSGKDSYGYKQGTSMACPHVSGALALAISYYWGSEHKAGLTPTMLRNALISSTKDVNQYCTNAYKGKMGIGSLDTYALLRTVKMLDIPFEDITLDVNEEKSLNLADYFNNTQAFTTTVGDALVVKAYTSKGILYLKGLKPGETTVKVSDTKAIGKTMKITVK